MQATAAGREGKRLSMQKILRLVTAALAGFVVVAAATVAPAAPAASAAAADNPATTQSSVPVVDGVVQPRRPLPAAIADAMAFLKKSDGGYVPGKADVNSPGAAKGEGLPAYFRTAHVLADGSPSARKFCFPGRQHAYFIFTFLHYGKYSGEGEWLLRARDLADWNLSHSTPADAAWPNLPWSAWTDGHGGGSQDKESTEPDKAAFLGSAYLALYEATKDAKYLDGAKKIADTLVAKQRDDGSWPFRVIPGDGKVFQDFGGAPVFYVDFFEQLQQLAPDPRYQKAYDRATKMMIDRNVDKNLWGTYHEDIREKAPGYLSAEPMSFTAAYLFRSAKRHPEYIDMGRKVLARMEERLVHTEGHPAAPAPAVSEQAGFQHMMPGHTARYCMALARLYAVTGDERARRTAVSGINALTYMQSPEGLFKTMFQLVNEKNPNKKREDWYSQHLYTVCHVLEAMPLLPKELSAPLTQPTPPTPPTPPR
jgi:hypothetical protein